METWDVFISHASEDKEYIVEPLVRVLEQNGISCWYDKRNIGWGDSLIDSISDGLNKSEYVLVILSQTFIEKGWTNAELNSMLSTEISSEEKKVLPLIVANEKYILNKFPLLRDKKYLVWNGQSKYIVDELKKVLGRESNSLFQSEESELSKIRQKLFTSNTIYELKKLLYEIEEYQSIYSSSIDAKILKDTVNEAILKTEKLSLKSTLNIKKIIYITASILLFAIFPFVIQNDTPIQSTSERVSDITIADIIIPITGGEIDNSSMVVGAAGQIIIPIEENITKTIKLEKMNDFNLTKKYTWKEAKEYCQNLVQDGHNNWRLPSQEEIFENLKFFRLKKNVNIILWTNDCYSSSKDICSINIYEDGTRIYQCPKNYFNSVVCVREK